MLIAMVLVYILVPFNHFSGETPLRIEASNGRMEVVTALLNAGADVNIADCRGMASILLPLFLLPRSNPSLRSD